MDYEQFCKEALILKSIRHPGIPIVYDLEDTADYSYMILEFLEGDSLYALVSHMGHFSKAVTIQYGIQICCLVSILHSVRPTPILYLDLQPKNLLVCHDVVKLIDFDHSVHMDEAETIRERYGTVGCAAPEQYTDDVLDERTDIYAIGAVLYYMLTGNYPEYPVHCPNNLVDRDMAQIIRTCMKKEKSKRYQSVEELRLHLEQTEKKMKGGVRNILGTSQISSLTIAVAGSSHGVGTTHIAMGLTAYLRSCGLSVIYEERNESDAVRQFASCISAGTDSFGICMVKGIPMLPFYGKAVKLKPHPYLTVIQDFGCDRKQWLLSEADGYLLVCGSKPWQWDAAKEAISDPGIPSGQVVIYNQFCGRLWSRLPGSAKKAENFLMPYDPNPILPCKAAKKIYNKLFLHFSEEKTGGIVRKLVGNIKGFIRCLLQKKSGGQSE